jgi:uncharacterized membrane protein YvlD (DUF360 family)
MIRAVRRGIIVWIIEICALILLSRLLPGLQLRDWQTAVLAIAAIGLLNALLRPILLFLTLPITLLTLGLPSLVLNALMIVLAARIVPGLSIDGWTTALWTTLWLAAMNTLFSGILALDDEDSYYQNVVEYIAKRTTSRDVGEHDGLIILEIDGLSRPSLDLAISKGYMPTMERWLASGGHRLTSWDCGVPSQTSSSQAGIMFGENFDIPGFRWYDKERQRMITSSNPVDAGEIEKRISENGGLLSRDGSSLGNMLSGDAGKSILTLSVMTSFGKNIISHSRSLYQYFFNPYNFSRAIVLMLWEIMVELWERAMQRIRNVTPRIRRGGLFWLSRAAVTILLRDLNFYTLIQDMFSGISIIYSTFIGYDTVAHTAGVNRPDSLRILRKLDKHFSRLEKVAGQTERRYHFVVLSDHGQCEGATFRQRYGLSLEQLVRRLLAGDQAVLAAVGALEANGYLHALISDALRPETRFYRAARRMLTGRGRRSLPQFEDELREISPGNERIVVCASGNLGLIYFADFEERLSLERIASMHPNLIEGLVGHEGIGFVMVASEQHGPVVIGHEGICYLRSSRIEGNDPLAPFGARAADHLRRLYTFPHIGDIVVNSTYYEDTGEVAAFEELVGSHGGLGGPQTEAFLMYPSDWETGAGEIVGAPEVYRILKGWLEMLQLKATGFESAERNA